MIRRIIPARAGCTRGRRSPAQTSRGSSPLARGAHDEGDRADTVGRIIPARAGCTAPLTGWWAGCRDHPRSRGVHSVASGVR